MPDFEIKKWDDGKDDKQMVAKRTASGTYTRNERGPSDSEKVEVPKFGDPDNHTRYDKNLFKAPEVKAPPIANEVTAAGKGGAELKVDTAALGQFAKTTTELKSMLDSAINLLGKVDVRPGFFGAARSITTTVQGGGSSGGLKGDTLNFLRNAGNTFTKIGEDMTKNVIPWYAQSEDMNKMTSDRLSELLGSSFQYIENGRGAGDAATNNSDVAKTGGTGTGTSGSGTGNGSSTAK